MEFFLDCLQEIYIMSFLSITAVAVALTGYILYKLYFFIGYQKKIEDYTIVRENKIDLCNTQLQSTSIKDQIEELEKFIGSETTVEQETKHLHELENDSSEEGDPKEDEKEFVLPKSWILLAKLKNKRSLLISQQRIHSMTRQDTMDIEEIRRVTLEEPVELQRRGFSERENER
jgi:hypothetical protein